ncbi:formate dehydrogenase accessory sulfurtransferase FdhD [Alcaligenaceae bacterium B3P038]|nr:formate dehydrogenase accessory sulfurtransferase FdhD [Alcaligenaceae bacterium B3P038]
MDITDLDLDRPLPADRIAAEVVRIRGGRRAPASAQDVLAEETPIALTYNGISHATMLASPTDLEDFAMGFSLTEGIVDAARDVRDIVLNVSDDGVVVDIEIASACMARLKTRRRALSGRTGCGLCGVETLPEVLRPVAPVTATTVMRLADLLAGMQAMRHAQVLHGATGATHAAAWLTATGALYAVREDVGRHNALDKLIGALARASMPAANGAFLVSSRASFEMVQKTAAAGCPILAAVSAPTGLAVRLAHTSGVTLAGFVRGDDATLYTHPQRLPD